MSTVQLRAPIGVGASASVERKAETGHCVIRAHVGARGAGDGLFTHWLLRHVQHALFPARETLQRRARRGACKRHLRFRVHPGGPPLFFFLV